MKDRQKIIDFFKASGQEAEEIAIRLTDLAESTEKGRPFAVGPFMSPYAVQVASTIAAHMRTVSARAWGGYHEAERVKIAFVNEDFGGTVDFGMKLLRATWDDRYRLIGHRDVLGALMGLLAGYFRGITEELIMRVVDVMLSFPSQIMVFAVVALLGINVQNVILANVFIKWAWYARMIRTGVMQYRDRNFVQFSRCVGTPERFILFRHLVPSIAADLAVLSSLDVGWAIINISTLSFLGLGVQAPTPEWGAMLSEAKNVLTSNPAQMLVPGIAIVVLVSAFNLMGDAIRDVLDPKEVL